MVITKIIAITVMILMIRKVTTGITVVTTITMVFDDYIYNCKCYYP